MRGRTVSTLLAMSVVLVMGAAFADEKAQPAAPPPAGQIQVTQPAAEPPVVDAAKASYAIGFQFGGQLKRAGADIDQASFLKGMDDAMKGNPSAYTDEELKAAMEGFRQAATKKMQEEMKKKSEDNAAAEQAFLAENAKKEGVVSLPSGLQYKIITEGTGKTPVATDRVKVNYKGTLLDGTEFDSSYARQRPAEFQVDKVIPGWTEGLQLMKEGSKWELYIPSKLAYGPQGPPKIGPNAMLIFEVELLEVLPAVTVDTPAAPPAAGQIKVEGSS